MTIHRYVALAARAQHGRAEFDLHRVIDVVEIDAVVVAHEEKVAGEGQVRIGGTVLNGRRSRKRLPVGSGERRRGRTGGVAGGEAGRLRQRWRASAGRMLLQPASYNPPLSPTRGSSDAERGLVKTDVLVDGRRGGLPGGEDGEEDAE